jgi:trimeric autotransporter adhesin
MKPHLPTLVLGVLLTTVLVRAQSTAVTYQGLLLDAGQPAEGSFDLQFSLFEADSGGDAIGGPVTQEGVAVSRGVFTALLDFGAGAFENQPRWIEVGVRPHLSGSAYTSLQPRQPVSPVPWAISALVAGDAVTARTVSAAAITTESIAEQAITEGKLAPGQVATSVNGLRDAVRLEGGANIDLATNGNALVLSSATWGLRGNSGTVAGTEFIGTTDDQPLELRVHDRAGLRLDPKTNGAAINVIAGHPGNGVDPGFWGATISGGGVDFGPGFTYLNRVASTYATIGGGAANWIEGVSGTVSGGFSNVIARGAVEGVVAGGSYNVIQDDALRATISGGFQNTIGPLCHHSNIGGGWTNTIAADSSVIGGGLHNSIEAYNGTIAGGNNHWIQPGANFCTVSGGGWNVIEADAFTSTIGGGASNRIMQASHRSTIAGGRLNTVGTEAPWSTIGGGYGNSIQNSAAAGVIPGGTSNTVAGAFGLAAGRRAQANEPGTFVWADSIDADFPSQGTNEFAIRATGGVRLVSAVDVAGTPLAGVSLAPGSGSWSTLSDRRSKENLESVDADAILEKVAALPLRTWNYVSQDKGTRHLGPMAQDFRAAFGLGEDERMIASVDADGIALAAVQGLHRRVCAQTEALHARDAQIAKLEAEISDLKTLIHATLERADSRGGSRPPPVQHP